jgi:DNA polymerase elongation subunit (family B)
VLLPLEASEKKEVLKHYFGITHNNELIARGIKIRRHDVTNFITQFQTELLCTLFDCKDIGEVMSKDTWREKEGIRTPLTVNEKEIISKRAEVGRVGFEPTTPAMSRRYLNQARPPALLN